jgi:hypothetical protein
MKNLSKKLRFDNRGKKIQLSEQITMMAHLQNRLFLQAR